MQNAARLGLLFQCNPLDLLRGPPEDMVLLHAMSIVVKDDRERAKKNKDQNDGKQIEFEGY